MYAKKTTKVKLNVSKDAEIANGEETSHHVTPVLTDIQKSNITLTIPSLVQRPMENKKQNVMMDAQLANW